MQNFPLPLFLLTHLEAAQKSSEKTVVFNQYTTFPMEN